MGENKSVYQYHFQKIPEELIFLIFIKSSYAGTETLISEEKARTISCWLFGESYFVLESMI